MMVGELDMVVGGLVELMPDLTVREKGGQKH